LLEGPFEVGPAGFLFLHDLGDACFHHLYERQETAFTDVAAFDRVGAGGEHYAGFMEFCDPLGHYVVVAEQHVEASAFADDLDFDRFGRKRFLEVFDIAEHGRVGGGARNVDLDDDPVARSCLCSTEASEEKAEGCDRDSSHCLVVSGLC